MVAGNYWKPRYEVGENVSGRPPPQLDHKPGQTVLSQNLYLNLNLNLNFVTALPGRVRDPAGKEVFQIHIHLLRTKVSNNCHPPSKVFMTMGFGY